VLTKIDPLSYAVDPLRRAVFNHVGSTASVAARVLNPGMSWNGWRVPSLVELGIVAFLGLVMLMAAMVQFARAE
jgi:ABC-2 type transport system permease protein